MTMIRVLTVTSRLAPAGGIPVAIRSLLRRSDPALVRHYVCQLRPLDGNEDDGSMPSLGGMLTLDLRARSMRSPAAIPAAARLLRIMGSLRPDVVHLHTGTSLIAVPAKLILRRRCGWLLDLHEPMSARHSALSSAVVGAMARHDTWCVTHSPPVTDEVARSLKIPGNRLVTIPLGIDVGRFESPQLGRAEWRTANGFPDDATLVVTVGKVSDMKGIFRLLDIAELMRSRGAQQTSFAVIGRVDQPAQITEQIRTRGLENSVRLLGFVEDLPSALNAADIYLAPSTYEGFGLSVAEAMAAGLPVVASAVGGLTYVVVDGKTGHIVEPEDIDGFARAIDVLASDPQHRLEQGRLARLRAREDFDEHVTATRYTDLYRRIVGSVEK